MAGWSEEVRHLGIPHPDWQPGQRQPPPFPSEERIIVDPAQEDAKTLFAFMVSAVVPRPIAFVATQSKDGVNNVSPYSYFNIMSHSPPYLAFGSLASERPSRLKDSQQNIMDTGEYVVNVVSEWFFEAMNHTCGKFDPEVDEIALAGLTTQPSTLVKPPRIAEAAVQMECKLRHTYPIRDKHGDVTSTIIIGEVVLIHALEAATTKTPHSKTTIMDIDKLRPVTRMGGISHGRTVEVYDLKQPPKEAQYRLYPETQPTPAP